MVFISTEKQMKYVALLILILVNFDSSAAQCLKFSSTFTNDSSGQDYVVHFADQYALDGCQLDVVMNGVEYATLKANADSLNFLNSVTATLIELFEFSAEDFGLINSLFIVAFITGHVLGRVSRLLGKTS